jgi:peptidyl-prolyl cis-trans isomerase C
MNRLSPLPVFLFAAPFLFGQLPGSTPVIQTPSHSLTKDEFERMLAADPRLAGAFANPDTRRKLGYDIGRAFVLEAEARRRQLHLSPQVELRIRNYTQQLLTNELLLQLRKDFLADEKALQARYEKNRTFYEQPSVRHILIRFQGSSVPLRPGRIDLSPEQAFQKAATLRAKIAAGAPFADVAKAESDDSGSAPNGGDLGFLRRGATAAPFEAAAFSLPIGQLSEPVRSEFGYHLLLVGQRRPAPLEEWKAAIANELAHEVIDGLVRNGFQLNPEYFGPPAK